MITQRWNFVLCFLSGISVTFLYYSYDEPCYYRPSYPMHQKSKSHKDKKSEEELDKAIWSQGPEFLLKEDAYMQKVDDNVARKLSEHVRVLVWVIVQPKSLETRAKTVKETWGKRCNKLLFLSSEDNADFPTIGLNVSEGRDHLTAKTMQGFRYVYKHFFHEYDWFIKADDDTYLIVENLRYFLSSQNTSEPIYFGHLLKTPGKQDINHSTMFPHGGSTEVLSKEALRRLAKQGNDSTVCAQDGDAEDVKLAHCLHRLGVKAANSTDALGRSRFHCQDPESHMFGKFKYWYPSMDPFGGRKKGRESISNYAISFHWVSPEKMLMIDFYLYHLRAYGINAGHQSLNKGNRKRLKK